jgi:tRNA modification GTPase
VASLARALDASQPELMAEDLRLALRAIGRITGRVDVEELLDVIFRDFCIGK